MTERDQECVLLESLGATEMETGMEEIVTARINQKFHYKQLRLLRLNHQGEIDVIAEKRLLVKEGSFSLSSHTIVIPNSTVPLRQLSTK